MKTNKPQKMRVAILGTGNIATDLLFKILKSSYLECTHFVGRNSNSPGIRKAKRLNINTSIDGINYLLENKDTFELIFDATTAEIHYKHSEAFRKIEKKIIDLTPSHLGRLCVPSINLKECLGADNINFITCSGQACIPLAYEVQKVQGNIEYIEVISSVSSKSVGPATRQNLEEYLISTEKALKQFTNCNKSRALLNINPAKPYVNMKVTLLIKTLHPNLIQIRKNINKAVRFIQRYMPGYKLIIPPSLQGDRLMMMLQVTGRGDYLPKYAGNLDIITCAALSTAEEIAKMRNTYA